MSTKTIIDPITFEKVSLKWKSGNGMLLMIGPKEDWVPESMVEVESTNGNTKVTMPRWLAKSNGWID